MKSPWNKERAKASVSQLVVRNREAVLIGSQLRGQFPPFFFRDFEKYILIENMLGIHLAGHTI